MAIFHLSAQIISAAEGRSAVAAAAYRHGAEMHRGLDGRDFNYQAKDDVEHEEIVLPPGAPAWANLRYAVGVSGGVAGRSSPSASDASARLWNDIEKRESQHSRRATAQLAREIEFSLPVEMTRAEQVALARDFISNSLAARGYACDWVLHVKEGNPHVHVMFTERVLAEGEGQWGNKIQTVNRRQQLLDLRAEWAMAANRHLERAGYEARIDHRSHQDLGLKIEPGVHRGSEPNGPARHEAWQARVAEDQAIARANEAWLRENPGELVKLAGVSHELVTRPVLMEEALKRLRFPDRAAAVAYVEAAIESGGLVPAAPAPADPDPVRERGQSATAQEIRVQAPVPAEHADPRSVEVLEMAAAWYREQLQGAQGAAVRTYLEERGFDPEAQERRGFGFAPRQYGALSTALKRQGVTIDELEAAGLVGRREEDGSAYDRFRDRLMFPILDEDGRCIAFGGRAMNERAQAKYLNSPQTRTFDKGRTVYNLGAAAEQAAETGALYLTEGYMDVASMTEAGVANVVAPLGTAVTSEQLELMWQKADRLVVVLDGDEAGRRAAGKVVDLALPLMHGDRELAFAALPEGEDPDSIIRDGELGRLGMLLGEASPLVEELWYRSIETVGGSIDSPERRAAVDKQLKDALAQIPDPAVRSRHLDELTAMDIEAFGFSALGGKTEDKDVAEETEPAMPTPAEPVLEPPAEETWNTVIHLHQVREVMSAAETLEASQFDPAGSVDVTALDALDLNEGQRLAAETILSADSRLGLVSGRAGTGKTHMLQAAAQLLTDQGIDVLGAAPSGRAAAELSSPHIRTRTVAGWLQQRMAWTPTGRPFVFVLDEAGMVGVRDMAALAQAVETRGGKLVLVGDSDQLQPIAAGVPFRMLRDRYGAAEMDWVQRQSDKGDRVATIALARGKSQDALAHYAEKGAITLHGGTMAAVETIAANYWQMDGQTVALAHRNVDVDKLNDAIRAAGVARGEVGGFEQFATREAIVKFGEGDRVIAIASLSDYKILKGTFGRVGRGQGGALAITFDGHDDPVPLNDRTAGRIGLGYAVTIHKSQGMTADNAMVLAGGTMDLHLGYVAFSRHREQLQIHIDRSSVDNVDQLASRLKRRAGAGREVAFAAAAAPEVERDGPGVMDIDPHVESVIVHYSNLLAAAGPTGIARTDTGRQYAADPSLLARHMAVRRSAWTVEEAARELARHIEEPLTFRRILTTALQDPDIMTLLPESPEHPERLLSSWSRIQLEADMVADAGLLAERNVRVASASAPAGDDLTDEQREAVTSLLDGPALQIVDGEAGSGKSTVAAALHDAAAKAGLPVSLVVPTRADAVLAREAVTDPGNVQTARSPLPAGPKPRLWIVDGAETVTQEDMSGILRRVQQTGGKVVLLGDRQAIQPLDAASPYLALGDRYPVMHMVGSLRPEDPEEREFIRKLASASSDDDHSALAWLDDEGRLVGAADMEGALNRAVASFLGDPVADKVLIAHTRAQVRALNDAVKARLPDRQARAVRMLGGGSIDLAVGDVVVIDKAIEGSIVPQAQRAVVTSVSEDGGKVGLDFGEHAESGRYASIAATSVRMVHGWARTVNSTRDAPASVHFLAGASTNRETVYAGLTRHRGQVTLYVPDPDAAGFAARQLATSGRQRFALDFADALTPDGQRMLADFLEDGGGAPEAWLERIHRTGRGHAMDRAMGDVGNGLVDFGQSWFARLLRMSAMGGDGSAQRMLPDAMFRNRPAPLIGTLFRDGGAPVSNAIGDALIRMAARPSGLAAAAKAGWIKNASFALAVGAGERLPGTQPLHGAGSQGEITKFLELGGGPRSNWLSRLFLERRAETAARAMAAKRVDRQVRRGILADLRIGADILDAPEDAWLMVSSERREEYEARATNALAAAKTVPTELDRAVARSMVAAEDSGNPELIRTGEALRDVVSAAPVRTSAELARDREDVLASLPRTGRVPAVSVFHELHRAFTPDEIDALMAPNKPLPASMPALPADRRQEIARYLLEQARNITPSRSIPWASRVRERVPGHGMDFSR